MLLRRRNPGSGTERGARSPAGYSSACLGPGPVSNRIGPLLVDSPPAPGIIITTTARREIVRPERQSGAVLPGLGYGSDLSPSRLAFALPRRFRARQ